VKEEMRVVLEDGKYRGLYFDRSSNGFIPITDENEHLLYGDEPEENERDE